MAQIINKFIVLRKEGKNKRDSARSPQSWYEDKISRVRSLKEHVASRSNRWGTPTGVALLLAIVLYSAFSPKDRFEQTRNILLKNPNNLEAHLALAEEFLESNQFEQAEKELLIAYRLQSANKNGSQVLGLSSKLDFLWQQKSESNTLNLKELITKWEKIVAETPTYTDGWLRLSLYYYRLGEREKAIEALEKAVKLNPSSEITKEIEKIIK